MANDPKSPNFASSRRSFMQAFGAASALLLSGCGSDNDGRNSNVLFPPAGNNGGLSGGGGGSAPLGGVPAVGRVDLSQVGGTGLNVLSIFQTQAPVENGSFSTSVSPEVPQTLLLLDGAGQVRALTLNLPGESPAFDARSSALAAVWIAPGIGASEAETARARIALVTGAASFAPLVEALAARLPGSDLPTALKSSTVRPLLDQVVSQVLAQLPTQPPTVGRVSARTAAEQVQVTSDGNVVLTRQRTAAGEDLQIGIQNEGWRFIKLVREDNFAGGQEVKFPALVGGPVPSDASIAQGRNSISLGSLFLAVATSPGTASDSVPQGSHRSNRLVYHVQGLGNLLHPDHTPPPAAVQKLLDSSDRLDFGLTLFYYFILPTLEPFLAVAGISGKVALKAAAEALGPYFTAGSSTATLVSSKLAANTNDSGNWNLAVSEVVTAVFGIAVTAIAQLVTGPVGAAAVALEVLLLAIGSVLSAINFAAASLYALNTPASANAELVIPNPFLARLGTSAEFQVQDLNDQGTLLYNRPDGMYLKENAKDAVLLLPGPGEGRVNSAGQAFYQLADHSQHALLRQATGERTTVPAPLGAISLGVFGLTQSGIPLGAGRRDDGKNDFFTRNDNLTNYLGMPEKLPDGSLDLGVSGSGDLYFSGNCSRRVPSGEWEGYLESILVKFTPAGTVIPRTYLKAGPPDSFSRFVSLSDKDEFLVRESWTEYGRAKPPGDKWNIFIQNQDIGPITERRRIYTEGPLGVREVASTRITDGQGEYVEAFGINDEGDVIGTLGEIRGQVNQIAPILWDRQGNQKDLRTLFPPNAPTAGFWTPLKISGRFILLSYIDPNQSISDVYLFYRGE